MEYPNKSYGVSGATTGANAERKTDSTTTASHAAGASASEGARAASARATGAGASLFPPRHYSFQALVAMGLLGFVVGRICR